MYEEKTNKNQQLQDSLINIELQEGEDLKKQHLQYEKEPQDQSLDPQIVLNFLEVYMIAISKQEFLWKEDAYWQFLELSDFNHEGIIKVKETWVEKRAGGRFEYQNCCRNLLSMINNWNRRYMVITQDGVMYSKGNRNPIKIREMLLFDSNFKMETGQSTTGKDFGIKLITSSRILVIKAYNFYQFVDIIMSFLEALEISPYTKIHRFTSFAPIRENAICKWYVDGNDYYQDVYDRLIGAKQQVYITDWWLSPELYLKRPVGPKLNQESRIDRVLELLAQRGVKIFILVYRESKIALTLDSEYTKQALQYNLKNHDNIIVLRHPNSVLPFLWSHHEKMVIVDQLYGFMGGLDLCYGRYDTQDHNLEDLPQKNKYDENQETVFFPGIDYSNVRIQDFTNVKNHSQSQIDRLTQPRMPWHDIHLQITGDPVKDMTRHFIQYWNFAKNNIYDKENEFGQIVPSMKSKDDFDQGMFKKGMVKFKLFKEKLKNRMKQNKEEKTDITQEQQNKVIGFEINQFNSNSNSNNDKNNIELSNNKNQAKSEKEGKNEGNKEKGQQDSNSSFKEYLNQVKFEQEQQNRNDEEYEEKEDNKQNPQNLDTTLENEQNTTTSHLNLQREKFQDLEDISQNNDKIKKNISQSAIRQNQRKSQKSIDSINQQNRKSYLDQDIYRPKRQSVCFYNTPQKYLQNSGQKEKEQEELQINLNINQGKNEKNDQSLEQQQEQLQDNSQNDINYQINENNENSEDDNNEEEEKEDKIKGEIEGIIFKKQNEDDNKKNSEENENDLDDDEKKNRIIQKLQKKFESGSKISNGKILSHQNTVQISDLNSRNKFAQSSSFGGSQFKFKVKRQKSVDDVQIYQDQNQLALPILEEIARECQKEEAINFYEKNEVNNNGSKTQQVDGNIKKNNFNLKNQQNNQNNKENEESEMQQLQQEEEQKRMRKQPEIQFLNNIQDKMGTCTCQMLRSASQWSLGLQPGHKEMSIQVAYIELITKAQHFIYIENQFFISNSAGNLVKNKIAQAIIDRIKLAAERKEKFKVVVIMPLLPGFEGEINGSNSTIMKCQLYWEYCTISRGGSSILEQLERDKNIQDPSEYIEFYGLRNHGKLNNKPVTEIIYVHSKLMIVDDNYVIIGSANINDRSQQGSRDSEVCMVIEDQYKVSGKLAGKNVQVGEFCTSLRRQLYQEHFGLTEEESIDPINQITLQNIKNQTKQNTEIYREVFACYPDDNFLTISQYEQFKQKENLDKYDELKDKIKGHAVQFPLYFLQRENLNLKYTNKEYFVPAESFT
ncbi:hypothetical protein PPERSA_13023 [Pseudocohnilembus persalinus]|uniref:phospholipase D n=1 Tax=Pseudocohnilembus persalinus TaxID=266149 RepID=A0A0V0R209_PSEPJ|nr:hypothetical protein PPERSA_13023 [Pseudocohnilembus persalinus]|eukprot:KRX08542.1 hypothetical protein PPERSA_13023 [Pseudocohnilembus persalinus]